MLYLKESFVQNYFEKKTAERIIHSQYFINYTKRIYNYIIDFTKKNSFISRNVSWSVDQYPYISTSMITFSSDKNYPLECNISISIYDILSDNNSSEKVLAKIMEAYNIFYQKNKDRFLDDGDIGSFDINRYPAPDSIYNDEIADIFFKLKMKNENYIKMVKNMY